MPVSVASEMLSMSAAEPEQPGDEQDHADEQRQRRQVARRVRRRPPPRPAAISVEPVSTAIVDVVLTESVRDPPSSAYTTIGTMHV